MTTVVALLRVSTDEQGRSGLGIEAQAEAIAGWCSRHSAVWTATFREIISGGAAIEDRHGLQAAVAYAKATGATLVVSKRDRLARDPLVSLMVEREVSVAAADGTGDGDDPSAHLLRRVLDGVAEFERKIIAVRVKDALAAKKRRGEHTGREPYGYRYEGKSLVPVPDEQRVLNRIFELRDERMPIRQISAHLNALGLRTRTGAAWHPTQVYRVSRREVTA